MELVLFSAWSQMIGDAKSSGDSGLQKLAVKLEGKVAKIQQREFPVMRRAYGKAVYQQLWVNNIETNVTGNRNATIQFTGGYFASNANKQKTQETLSDILTMFRFKKVNYKWYKYDEEFTYYTLDTPPDGTLLAQK